MKFLIELLWKLPILRRLNEYMNKSRESFDRMEQRQEVMIQSVNQLLEGIRENQSQVLDELRQNQSLVLDEIRQNQGQVLDEIRENHNQVLYEIRQNQDQCREINWIANDTRNNAIDMRGELRTLIKQEQIRFWQNYSMVLGKSVDESKKIFFESIPKADGNTKVLQMGNAKLLKKLVEICEEYDWEYWLQSGTLLGAIRHKGFVPWDDDTDIAMFRDDIIALKELLKHDGKYRVTLIYDWYWKSRQIRFRYKDESIPCFVDIYIYDECSDGSYELWQKRCEFKSQIVSEWEQNDSEIAKKWRETPWTEENSEIAPELKKYFDEKVQEYKRRFESDENNGVMWGIDNFECSWQRSFDKDYLFPPAYLEYENEMYKAPKEYMKYVERQYGDIYELPMDLATHYEHIDRSLLTEEVIDRIKGEVTEE